MSLPVESKSLLNDVILQVEKKFNEIAKKSVVNQNDRYVFDEDYFYLEAQKAFEKILKKSNIASTIYSIKDIEQMIDSFQIAASVKISKSQFKKILNKQE